MPPRIVLDTNVALDLFVFHDAGSAHLFAALQAGTVQAVADVACRAEWLAVLGYPLLALDEAARRAAAEAFDRWTQRLPPSPQDLALPRCSDPDDQKFIELAHAAGARWLFSKDKAVLKLARRAARAGLSFAIVTPSAWVPPSP